jgi:hypothetical protein
LWKRLQNAVELQPAQRLTDMTSPDAELRGELAFRREAITSLERTAREQIPDLPHDQVRWFLELDRAQLRDDRRGLGHVGQNWLTSD